MSDTDTTSEVPKVPSLDHLKIGRPKFEDDQKIMYCNILPINVAYVPYIPTLEVKALLHDVSHDRDIQKALSSAPLIDYDDFAESNHIYTPYPGFNIDAHTVLGNQIRCDIEWDYQAQASYYAITCDMNRLTDEEYERYRSAINPSIQVVSIAIKIEETGNLIITRPLSVLAIGLSTRTRVEGEVTARPTVTERGTTDTTISEFIDDRLRDGPVNP